MDIPGATKTCSKCKKTKPVSEFSPGKSYRDGYRTECKKCRALDQLQRNRTPEGMEIARQIREKEEAERRIVVRRRKELEMPEISRQELDALHKEYDSRCGVCGVKHRKTPHLQLLVDHDYRTGERRGLLCSTCYTAMCQFGDDLEGIMRVVDYLKRYE